MIRVENLRSLLESLGYSREQHLLDEVWRREFAEGHGAIAVSFTRGKIVYPEGLITHRETTTNFKAPENFVVLECVSRLLGLGYLPHQLELERPMPGGHADTGGYCDILVKDNDGVEFLLIECKTSDSTVSNEFSRAWSRMQENGGQLFNYFNTYRRAKALCLYTSDWVEGRCIYASHIVQMEDNEDYLLADPQLEGFAAVRKRQGGRDDYFRVWRQTYELDYSTAGIFEPGSALFAIGKRVRKMEDLKEADGVAIQKKYHEYATILRQHNVAGRENAFDKLVNLFVAKIVDERVNANALRFYWGGAATDDYYSLQDRLQQMYSLGMREFLNEKVTYIDNGMLRDAFRLFRNDPDATRDTVLDYFRQQKFYTNNDFAFLDVHNQDLFRQNAEVLRKVVGMLQDLRLCTAQQHQFLGDFFEGFLDQGVKQSEGQFFTPMPIVRFLVSSLPLESIMKEGNGIPLAIDYACGAGHFLNEYARQVEPIAQRMGRNTMEYYAGIHGIEKEYRLSKVAKVSAFMYGQDSIRIVYHDALQPHPDIADGSYSVLVANPPYSVKGFLATLPEQARRGYSLSQYVSDIEANNSIEVFFIERAAQLLRPGGVAAIILPSSVLTNGNIYIRGREIVLEQFDIVAITEFGSGTFGKTGTNTVTLFLRKRADVAPLRTHYRNRVEAWFAGDTSKDVVFGDAHLLGEYCLAIGVDVEDYQVFASGNPGEAMWGRGIFKQYRESFSTDSEAKRILRKRLTDRYTQADQVAELAGYVLEASRAREREKLYYYLLAKSNPLPVLVVKSPAGMAETKAFLGYEWSSRKGDEGIKYLGVEEPAPEGVSPNSQGIERIVTPLFNPSDGDDPTRINTLIRSYFLGNPLPIPKELTTYCATIRAEEMLDFGRVEFDKQINTNLSAKRVIQSRYPLVYVGELAEIASGNSAPQDRALFEGGVYPFFRTSDVGAVHLSKSLSTVRDYLNDKGIEGLRLFRKGTILFPKSGASTYLDHRVMMGVDGYVSSHLATFYTKDPSHLLQEYLYEYLAITSAKEIKPTSGYPSLNVEDLKSIEIPLPPLAVQQRIMEACAEVDQEYEHSRMAVEERRRQKEKIFEEFDAFIISTGGGFLFLKDVVCLATDGSMVSDYTSYVTTDTMLPECGGITPYAGSQNVVSGTVYQPGDILLSNIRPYLKKIWLADRQGICSKDVLVLRVTEPDKYLPAYLYCMLARDRFFSYAMQGARGVKMPRGDKQQILRYQLPVVALERQRKLIITIAEYEEQIHAAQEIMKGCTAKKRQVLMQFLE